MKPKKISAHAIGAALAAVAVWCINAWSGMEVPAEVAVAFGTIAAGIVSWIVPDEIEA